MMCSEFPNRPWEKVASDLFEHNKQSYLLVDYYSRYIEIARLHSTNSNAVINHLKSIFARHGIPQTFISDNGQQYCGNSFRGFSKSYGFEHITRGPRYPQSNGLAERAVGTVQRMLTKSEDPYLALLAYRTTPLGNGYSPSELLMGRRLQSTLAIVSDELKPRQANNELLRQKERDYKQRQKLNYDRRHRATNLEKLEPNDNVYVKDQKIWGKLNKTLTPRVRTLLRQKGVT